MVFILSYTIKYLKRSKTYSKKFNWFEIHPQHCSMAWGVYIIQITPNYVAQFPEWNHGPVVPWRGGHTLASHRIQLEYKIDSLVSQHGYFYRTMCWLNFYLTSGLVPSWMLIKVSCTLYFQIKYFHIIITTLITKQFAIPYTIGVTWLFLMNKIHHTLVLLHYTISKLF